ncbi:MAG: leucyl aminopeptidase [Betaproteobacteria bacterium]|nr:MAG: leucyl aminopeptidase [Betaproteobacteria bacterium]
MEFNTKFAVPEKHQVACVAAGVFESRKLSDAADALDKAAHGQIRELLRSGDMDGKMGSTRLLYRVPGVAAERVLLVGLGREKDFGEKQYRDCARAALAAVQETGARDACVYFAELHVPDRDAAWKARQLVLAAADVTYRFDRMKSKKAEETSLVHVAISAASKRDAAALERGMREGSAIAAGMTLARDLGNLPANVCTPTYLADTSVKLGHEWKLAVEVLEQKDMEKLRMGSLLSVTRGSHQPPKFVILRYSGASSKDRPVVLVGKGITFDTGGISIKPSAEMDEMKFDMCGAASVLGTLRAAAELGLKLNVIGLVPACENMPGGAATKPGDIVTSMSGQTIEILNTDAEGRLILADALSYAERFEPQAVVDIATLTRACVVALGHVCSGLFANKDALADEVQAAGAESLDRVWRLPLWEDYQEQLKSNFADFANIGGPAAGSVTAACFLSRFAGKYDWAHLDIAGTAWKSGKEKGATGRPVPLLTMFLIKRAEN